MRIIDEDRKTITDPDLTAGYLTEEIIVRQDADPIDNVTKFAWADDDYEVVQMYHLNPDPEPFEPTAEDDRDAMMVDHELRLTMLELGIFEE